MHPLRRDNKTAMEKYDALRLQIAVLRNTIEHCTDVAELCRLQETLDDLSNEYAQFTCAMDCTYRVQTQRPAREIVSSEPRAVTDNAVMETQYSLGESLCCNPPYNTPDTGNGSARLCSVCQNRASICSVQPCVHLCWCAPHAAMCARCKCCVSTITRACRALVTANPDSLKCSNK